MKKILFVLCLIFISLTITSCKKDEKTIVVGATASPHGEILQFAKKYVEEKGLKTVNDEGALRKVIEDVVANNPQSVEDYRSGKEKAIGFLVGQTMKAMKGKADPSMINQILKEIL